MCGNGTRPPTDYRTLDTGGRGNGHHEPNAPWWTLDLAPRWARLTLAACIVVFGVTLSAACSRAPDDDDLPGQVDTSLDDNPCADPDQAPANCEDLAP